MNQKSFGISKKGDKVTLYTMENDNILCSVMDYGATLVSLTEKKTGIDVVAGFDDIAGYEDQTSYIGASIGRTANRIEKGIFTLNGKEYHIPINNNGNANHGGLEGFNAKMYQTECTANSVSFTRISPDQEEGYPGNLTVRITYVLTDTGIEIISEGTSDEDTLFAYTNHSYFNLNESETIKDHKLTIPSHTYADLNPDGLTLEVFHDVENTPFDFTKGKEIGKDIEADDIQLKYGKGYDHHYVFEGEGMKQMAVLEGKKLELIVSADFPGMHLYTGNWLENKVGKKGRRYPEYSCTAFEPEYIPNAVNYSDKMKKPIVHKGETIRHTIRYDLRVKES